MRSSAQEASHRYKQFHLWFPDISKEKSRLYVETTAYLLFRVYCLERQATTPIPTQVRYEHHPASQSNF